MLPLRTLGNTGIRTSALALGGRQLANSSLTQAEVASLVDQAIDHGMDVIDTSPTFAGAQEWVAKALQRGQRVKVCAKLGHGVAGAMDWTADSVTIGIHQALQRTGAEALDIAYLHGCSAETLEKNGVVEALGEAVEAGKVKAAGYAGEGDGLVWAVRSKAFGVVQASVSCCDPAAGRDLLRRAVARGIGVVAKRSMANAPWLEELAPADAAATEYQRRWEAMGLQVEMPPEELALRWTVYHPAVHVALTGTSSVAHLQANVQAVAMGPLPRHVVALVDGAHRRHEQDWLGQM
ncbi:MAG: aldo/keto reductase [Myxococcales bacterium]|nr:aldo/keto reductase [Myxococcales bacterium]